MKEVWKDVKGYEGYYQVSNKGNVKSLCRVCIVRDVSRKGHRKHNEYWRRQSKMLKPVNCGLPVVRLYRDYQNVTVKKQIAVKYLVAQAFVEGFTDETKTRDIHLIDKSKPITADNIYIVKSL